MIRKREKMFNRETLSNLNYMNIDNNETVPLFTKVNIQEDGILQLATNFNRK